MYFITVITCTVKMYYGRVSNIIVVNVLLKANNIVIVNVLLRVNNIIVVNVVKEVKV